MLKLIQDKLGGSIKQRSGVKHYRYRLHNKTNILILISLINGHIRHSNRLYQLHQVCKKLSIDIIIPIPLTEPSSYHGGFFDASAHIDFYIKDNTPQLTISITQKLLINIQLITTALNGNIYYDTSQKGCFKWSIQSKVDVLQAASVFKNYCHSRKAQQFFLVAEYYELLAKQAYRSGSPYAKAWVDFKDRWQK